MPLDSHELSDGRTVKLGRPERSPDSPKDLHLHRFLLPPSVLPKPPEVIDNTVKVAQPWPMLGNDRHGDCVFASSGHRRITQAAMQGVTVTVTDQETLAAYSAVTGFDLQTGANDNGAIMVDAANWERRNALSGDTIYAFARVKIDPRDTEMLNVATYYLGGVWFGINLPTSAQHQVGSVWDVASGPDGAPGSWGGHAVWSPRSSPDTRDIVTWAKMQQMSHAFVAGYADEAWALLPGSWQSNDPFGAVDWGALNSAIAQFGPVDPAQ